MNDAGVTLTHEFHLLPRREGNDHVNFRIGKRGFGFIGNREPRMVALLRCPDCGKENYAMAVGEGIETTASWYQMGVGPDDVGIAAGINVGNMAGQSLGRVKHPRLPSKMIPDGNPDMTSVAMAFPPEVKSVILLGDGDSDGPWTRMMMMTAAHRLQASGLEASVCFAADGEDFNSMLRRGAA